MEFTYSIPQEKTGTTLMDTNSSQKKNSNKESPPQKGFIEQWQNKSDAMLIAYFKLFKKLLKKMGKFIPIIIGYSIMSWMFLGVYDTIGFEKTLIILLVGVFWYGIRGMVSHG